MSWENVLLHPSLHTVYEQAHKAANDKFGWEERDDLQCLLGDVFAG